jgi:hypothetical protein
MKRPAFQFYPSDWRNNANLRRCSPAARGVWVDIMCVLHDSDEYGIVRWPLIDLSNASNAPMKLIRELVEKSVLKGHDKRLQAPYIYTPRSGRCDGEPVTLIGIQDGPVWYSSRMVRDEYVRTIRGESTRFGEPKAAPKPPFGDGSTVSSSSSTTLNTRIPDALAAQPLLEPAGPERVSKTGAICIVLKSEGIASVNPSHPDLAALIDAGAEVGQFAAAARAATAKGKGFAYALGIVKSQMRDAASLAAESLAKPRDSPRQTETFRERDDRNSRAKWEEMTNRKWPETSKKPIVVINEMIDITTKRLAV